MKLTIFFLLSLLTCIVHSATAACYHLDGSVISTNFACLSSGASPCCAKGWACLKNGLCQWTAAAGGTIPDSVFARGSCTDKKWTSKSCPSYCVVPGLDSFSGGEYMMKCPGMDFYYCDNSAGSVANNCTKGGLGYPLIPDGFATLAVIGQTSSSLTSATIQLVTTIKVQTTTVSITTSNSIPSSSSNSSLSSTSSTSSSSSSSPSSNISNLLDPQGSTTPPSPATPSSASGASPATAAANPSSGSKIDTTAIGVGLGVGLGVLAIALVLTVWLLRRKRRREVPSPPPFRPASHTQETVEPNDKYVQDPLMHPQTPTSSTRYSQPPPLYGETSGGESSRNQGPEIHELP